MQHVFVYGTLRAGEINDIRDAAGRHGIPLPERLGPATLNGRLYDFGAYPGMVVDAAGGPVLGDVYRVDARLVPVLDEIEEVYPGVEGLFVAQQIDVDVGGARVQCLFYPVRAASVEGRPQISGGDWVAYRRGASSGAAASA